MFGMFFQKRIVTKNKPSPQGEFLDSQEELYTSTFAKVVNLHLDLPVIDIILI
jgi:hypothetical protein